MTAEDVIAALGLQPLPMEGGSFRETYRSADYIGDKALATAIYYLITPTSSSATVPFAERRAISLLPRRSGRAIALVSRRGGRVVDVGRHDLSAGQRPTGAGPCAASGKDRGCSPAAASRCWAPR